MITIIDQGILINWESLYWTWKWSIIPLLVLSYISIALLSSYHFRWLKHFWMPPIWIITIGWIGYFVYKGIT